MKKVLITGANGFIGKNIKESYLSQIYNIFAPSKEELNLTDTESLKNYFVNKEFDVLLHCAAKPGHRNAKDQTEIFTTNTKMFDNLLLYKDSIGKLISFGSGAIYDQSKDISNAVETDIGSKAPEDEYGAYKYYENSLIENLGNCINLNLFGIFGKYEDWEIRFISNAICKTIFNLPITLRQNRRFSYLFIDDLMPVLEFFIENKTEYKTYNVVPKHGTELLSLAKIVQDTAKNKTSIVVYKEGYAKDYTGSCKRLEKEFKSLKFTPLNESIEKLYEYYERNKNIIDVNLLNTDK